MFYTKESPVHGIGLFAKEFIPMGTVWWQGTVGKNVIVFSEHQYNALLESNHSAMLDEIHKYAYYDFRTDGLIYICDDARYINHSTNPNCKHPLAKFISITTRDIQKDEELFEDYESYANCPWQRYSPNRL
jgi:SET domain-containing protein